MSRRWRCEKPVDLRKVEGKIVVAIFTYDRPEMLRKLLSDVRAFGRHHDLTVWVFEDKSDADYAECREFADHWVAAEEHYGKKRFWDWVAKAYAQLRQQEMDYFIQLADDCRLCEGFFDHAIRFWNSIGDGKRICMNVWRDPREYCWTGRTPIDISDDVRETGWVDGALVSGKEYLSVRIRPIPENFWDLNPLRGSGVGQRITTYWDGCGRKMYQVKRSLIVHVGTSESKMNPEDRKKHPLPAVGFRDGDRMSGVLQPGEKVTASLASIPRRKALLEQTVASLLPHVDQLNVYLNVYAEVPSFLKHPRICVARSQDHGDRGDAGKFFWCETVEGYHLTCDDDIVYPPNYVHTMIRAVERYQRNAFVSVHGSRLFDLRRPMFHSRHIYSCKRRLKRDIRVHLPGTGCLAYHANSLRVRRSDIKPNNMADVWIGVLAKKENVPVYTIQHPRGWLTAWNDEEGSIFESSRWCAKAQNEILQREAPWPRVEQVLQ